MATGRNDAHPPWNRIGQNASDFFAEECLPVGFVFQDPSRMGKSVKRLIDHLRVRQEIHGVNTFNFNFTMNGNSMQPTSYPASATEAIAAGIKVVQWPVAKDVAPAVVNDVFLDSHSGQGAGLPSQTEDSQAALVPIEHDIRCILLLLFMNLLNARYRNTLHCRQKHRNVGFSWTILVMNAMCNFPTPSQDIVPYLSIPLIPISPIRPLLHHQAKSRCCSVSHRCQMYRWHPMTAYLICRDNSIHNHGLRILMSGSHWL
jgi:hypothetical protein